MLQNARLVIVVVVIACLALTVFQAIELVRSNQRVWQNDATISAMTVYLTNMTAQLHECQSQRHMCEALKEQCCR